VLDNVFVLEFGRELAFERLYHVAHQFIGAVFTLLTELAVKEFEGEVDGLDALRGLGDVETGDVGDVGVEVDRGGERVVVVLEVAGVFVRVAVARVLLSVLHVDRALLVERGLLVAGLHARELAGRERVDDVFSVAGRLELLLGTRAELPHVDLGALLLGVAPARA